MQRKKRFACFLILWALAVTVVGGAMMSYHQPFQLPSSSILSLVEQPGDSRWEAIHVLSGSCGCSQRLMRRLLERHLVGGYEEQILMVDGEEPVLPETASLLGRLELVGFRVTHIAETSVPVAIGLHGLPLLVVASPQRKVAYLGGYGARGDQDARILQQARSGEAPKPFPVIGCVVGTALRRKADPLQLKYR
jgi:hypothetical protein